MSQKDLEQIPASILSGLMSRVAARARSNWLANKDTRTIRENASLVNEIGPSINNFHFKLLGLLSNGFSTNSYNDVVRFVEDEGRNLANRAIPLEKVVENTSACLNRWVSMALEEAEQDLVLKGQPKAYQGLVHRLNQIQSRLLVATITGYNEQLESGEVWLYRQSSARNALLLTRNSQHQAEHFFEQLTSITREFSINRYRAGVPIFSDTQELQRSRFYFIRTGTVQLQEYLSDGRALTLTILGKGDVFARFANSTKIGTGNYFHDFQVETMRDTELVWVDECALQTAMERSPVVATGIIKSFSNQLANVQQLIQGLLGRDVSARLAHLLLKLCDEFGVNQPDNSILIDYPLSHQRLADMMGSNRVTVTRQLSELQKQGILEIQRRSINIYNRRMLEASSF